MFEFLHSNLRQKPYSKSETIENIRACNGKMENLIFVSYNHALKNFTIQLEDEIPSSQKWLLEVVDE